MKNLRLTAGLVSLSLLGIYCLAASRDMAAPLRLFVVLTTTLLIAVSIGGVINCTEQVRFKRFKKYGPKLKDSGNL
jgi:hypothetical protein